MVNVEKHESNHQSPYLTRKEVAEHLKISLVSLHKWTNEGLLMAYRLGRRVYYKRVEVDAALTRMPSKKGGAND
jgi:excisionase family DNA binding protein